MEDITNNIKSYERIAQVLRADKDTVLSVEKIMREICGHDHVLDRIVKENDEIMKNRMSLLGIEMEQSKEFYPYQRPLGAWIYVALLNKIKADDQKLAESLNYPVCITPNGCGSLFGPIKKATNLKNGFFLKIEKAKEFLINTPPQNVVKSLGYQSAKDMLEKEDIFEIFSALRFMEDGEWLNNVFFKQYEGLTPVDFEEREVKTIVLGEQWKGVAEKFLRKKHHNISHLKEMGVIFILPAFLNVSGETLRTASLVLHYLHEIDFYSKLFRKYAKEGDFAARFISSLRGDVLDSRFDEKDLGKKWMIIQRYLAKDDKNDWRLFEPHINPEAIHWKKAENDIGLLGKEIGGLDLSFWKDLDYIGDFFPAKSGIDVLVSFNLVDTAMSLVKEKDMVKYLYHHQEALWNKIFSGFVGEEKMEEMIIDNFEKGYIDLQITNNK